MSGNSSVGQAQVYEAGDQRKVKQSEVEGAERFNEGVENSHKPTDSKDERSIANRLENESRRSEGKELTEEQRLGQLDPTLPAKRHGNEPSKGAKIDAQIQAEEDEELRRKGKK